MNKGECMVDRCTDAQIDTEGYKRIELAIPPGGPSCSKHSLWNGYITLKCSLLSEAVFGQNRGEYNILDEGDDSLICIIVLTDLCIRFFPSCTQIIAYQTTADSCAPWLESSSKLGFKNTATGATLEVAFVRHW